jgi:hypothetical protein
MKPNPIALVLPALALLAGCAAAPKPQPAAAPAAQAAPANDFPTLTRVEYVLSCMQEKGGKNYDNLYHCVCAVDHVAAKLPHEEFLQAETFATNVNLPGERGGVFRDPPQSKMLRDKLQAAIQEANAACFPGGGKVSAPKAK